MYLKAGEIDKKDYKMIVKDYYEKFEKQSGKTSNYRKMSIEALQNGLDNFVARIVDKNYIATRDYLDGKGSAQLLVSLKEGNHYIAYAVVDCDYFNEDVVNFKIDDIIIHNEEELEDLAGGEISIRRNIYNKIVEHIHYILNTHQDYKIEFNMVDSADLYDVLKLHGYEINNDLLSENIEDLLKTGQLQMYKAFSLNKEDKNELRLTRKQNQK